MRIPSAILVVLIAGATAFGQELPSFPSNLYNERSPEGVFDVLVGINLLREGLDIPECALVAILDADKEGFLRSEGSLIQTIGREIGRAHV